MTVAQAPLFGASNVVRPTGSFCTASSHSGLFVRATSFPGLVRKYAVLNARIFARKASGFSSTAVAGHFAIQPVDRIADEIIRRSALSVKIKMVRDASDK